MTDLIADLDRIIDRIVRNDSVLVLERESADWWTVSDSANGGEVMMRADRELCVRFLRAFIVRHPESRLDRSGSDWMEHSWRVAQEQLARDIADSPHGNLTIDEACEKLASVLPFPRMAEALDDAS